MELGNAKHGKLSSLLRKVMQGRTEISIFELLGVFEHSPELPLLESLLTLKNELIELQLSVHPGFEEGDIYTTRCLALDQEFVGSEAAKLEIARLESTKLEFKSSLVFDCRKHEQNPHLEPVECRSESVTQSALKTIAAFLNTEGGLLYVGVDDSGIARGLDGDIACFNSKKANGNDSWQLALQDFLRGRFKDGDSIGNYISVMFIELEGKSVARIEVAPRRKLSFLKGKDGWELYRRDGNRTLQVTIDQVEEFLSTRASRSE